MTTDLFSKTVRSFHETCNLPVDNPITNQDLLALRLRLIDEEVQELKEAAQAAARDPSPANRAMMLRELADVQYVLAGFAVSFGLPLADGFSRIHQSNLSRLEDGKPVKDATGKVLKGKDFHPPQLEDLVDDDLC